MKQKLMLFILIVGLVLGACSPVDASEPYVPPVPTATVEPTPVVPVPTAVAPVTGMPAGTDGYPWWNDTVFYQIFLRSFQDSDGDGIGDINGLISRLDYLNDGDPTTTDDLGVTGIWLLPIHPSPSYHGYDVLDYYEVNPDYGTMEDFQRLLDEAHQRGIRVIIDLVLNHTSSRHTWFRASRDPDSEYRDWYIWEESDPGYLGPWNQRVWHPSGTGSYYYGVFWDGMPDLNYQTPEVTTQMLDVARFWLEDVGVDGFRVDGAQHLIEDGRVQRHSDATHEWLKVFRTFYKEVNPDAISVGEVWDSNFAVAGYVKGDEFDLAFNFDLAEAIIASANTGSPRSLRDAYNFTNRLFEPGQFSTFLTNHDIDRIMSQLRGDDQKARVAATLLLAGPGVPFIYYGEEIGLTGQKPDELIRTPMQWSGEDGGGFTTGLPWQRINLDYTEKNVQAQSAAPDSLLSHYRTLVQLRNQHAALRVGSMTLVETDSPGLFASLRVTGSEVVMVLVNLGDTEISSYNLSLAQGPLSGSYHAVALLGQPSISENTFAALTANDQGGFDAYQPLPSLPPYSSVIIQLQSR